MDVIFSPPSTTRGNPEYKDVASMPYKTECLEGIATNETDLHTLGEYSMNVKPKVISSKDVDNHNSYRDYEGNVNITQVG